MYRCTDCGTAYLDPRPDESSIHIAYSSYSTHESQREPGSSIHGLALIRRSLGNGFLNCVYGTQFTPSLSAGYALYSAVPFLRKRISSMLRNLPKCSGARKLLLDVGSGNGDYLALATALGWETIGIEPDSAAAQVARKRGFKIDQRTFGAFSGTPESFDWISMSHVIEHIHNPILALQKAFTLLRPGGHLWLETPNIDSRGHQLFGPSWRGLEPPRHLTIFNTESMTNSLLRAGFRPTDQIFRPGVPRSTFPISRRLYRDMRKHIPLPELSPLVALPFVADWQAKRNTRQAEFMTYLAQKPRPH